MKRRMIAYANLKAAFPDRASMELKRINKAHFENLGMSIIELLKMPFMRKDYIGKHIKIENVDAIESSLEKGKGAIILTAHFGNWEIASLAASLNGYAMSVFAREQKYKRLDNLLNQFRQSTGCKVITKGFSVKDIIRTLNNNGIIGMLSDQDAGANGVFVDFFNRPASTAKGIVVFSSKTGADILPSFIWRVGADKHMAIVRKAFELVNTGNKENDIRENLQRITDILEDYIRRFPEQWLWAHKRWKSTPQRNILVLSDGKAGHLNQAMGVAEMVEEALGSRLKTRGIQKKPIVKIHTIEVRFKNKFTIMLLKLMSIFTSRRCQGCLKCLKFCLAKESFENLKNKYADIVISCGASTVPVNIFLKYENNAKNVVIMKPGLGRSREIDLVLLPRHDTITVGNGLPRTEMLDTDVLGTEVKPFPTQKRKRSNIVVTEGAPNRITQKAMNEAVKMVNGERWRAEGVIGVLIGGDAKGFRLKKEDVEKVVDNVIKISEEKNLDIFVSTSRRTSPEIDRLLKEKLNNNKRCKLLIIANEKNIDGTAAGIFGLSDIIVTSSESMSMISEAASSGKYVLVFRDEGQKTKGKEKKSKYSRMVLNLERQGYIYSAEPNEIYDKIKGILEIRPEIKRLNDREKIIEKLKVIV